MPANRDTFVACPACQSGLDPIPDEQRLACGKGCGALVTEPRLLELISAVLGASVERPDALPFVASEELEPVIMCPRCTTTMTKLALYGIQVDRCERHGVWFDRDELQRVLVHHGLSDPDPGGERLRKVIGSASVGVIFALSIIRYIFFL